MKTNPRIGNRNACGFDCNSSWLAGTIPLIRHRGLDCLGKTSRRFASSVMLAAAVFAAPLQAQIVFDAGKDFSTNQNPNWVWSYGWWNASDRIFALYTGLRPITESGPSGNPRIWHLYVAGPGGEEAIFALGASGNLTDEPGNIATMTLPPRAIHLHPGGGNEYSVIRWTAPFSGVVNINTAFEGMNPNGTTTDVHVWHNGIALYDASVNGFGVGSRVAFQGTATVFIGDTIDFGVGYGNGSHYCDSTLLDATITLNPSGGAIFLRQGAYSIAESNATLPVEVLRVGPDYLDVPVTVDYTTVDGTAHAGEDYMATAGTLHFAAGETNKLLTVPILNDALHESEEQFRLVLSNPTGGVSLANSNVVIRIQDNDPGVRFETENVVASETAGAVTIVVQRGDDLGLPFTVDYATVDETAHAGEDYVATSGTLHFAVGETNKQITIPILNDAIKESEEQFLLVLSNATGGVSLANSNVVIRIEDNNPFVRFETENVAVSEAVGVVTVVVQRGDQHDLNLPFTVDYATVAGTAHAGEDYVAASGTLQFAAGETNKQIVITILNDALQEPWEQFRLVLGNPTGGVSLGNSNVVIWIQNDVPMTYYVNVNNPNPVFPYASWATAATNIQDAVDAASSGDTVLVTNGMYAVGSKDGNRVSIMNAIRLESVNGPVVTTVMGITVEEGEGRPGRCVYLGSNAVLSGFTLRGGVESRGSGIFAEPSGVVTNCVIIGNRAGYYINTGRGGGVYGGTLFNCTLRNNSAGSTMWGDGGGGGAIYSTLYNCTLSGNSCEYGGGAYDCILYNCTLTGNSGERGGGACGGTLNNCTLTGNSATYGGGGAYGSTLYNCTLIGNSAIQQWWLGFYTAGGGAYGSTLCNCIVTENAGGGVSGSTLYNCTVAGNSGGGVGSGWNGEGSTLYNSIVYYNFAGNYDEGTTLNYCCTTPLPAHGVGNIDADPQLTSDNHLLPTSPCVAAGNAAYATGRDIDEELWANPPSMGADQFVPGPVTGPLTMQIHSDYSQVAQGYALMFMAQNTGRLVRLVWDFGDSTVVTNQPHISHAWTAPGVYSVRLTGYNDSFPAGVSSTVQVEVVDAVHYVNAANLNPVFPYTSWATAATNIQDAVAVSTVPGRLVLVTNGVYRTGSVEANGPNRVVLTNTLVLRSVNGPAVTTIEGTLADQPVRCAYVGNRAVLSGFTLARGGGAYCEPSGVGGVGSVVTNCVITGNSGGGVSGGNLYNCTVSGNSGGGVHGSTLRNCIVTSNLDGGAYGSTLYNCTLTANSGPGASKCSLYNCIVYHNRTPDGANYSGGTFEYSCTSPLPPGAGNIDAYPQLTWDMHLLPTSPCVSAGKVAYATGQDIDGELWANPPSMGADEFVPGSITGALTMEIHSDTSQVAPGYALAFVARNTGRLVRLVWDFGDGTLVTNQPFTSHTWGTPGDYTVRLTGYNDSFPLGVTTAAQVEVINTFHYVSQSSLNPVLPYTSWATAATNIQEAVAATTVPGRSVLVTNGVYRTGSFTANGSNRVGLTNVVVLRSVNGPAVTTIEGASGDQPTRCVYVGNGAALSGFTLTNGRAAGASWYPKNLGGGVYCEPLGVVTNCVISGNSAAAGGGGAYGGTLSSSTLTGNSANDGGGANSSILYNCTLTDNSAQNSPSHAGFGGGAYGSTLYNCTLTGNSAYSGGGAISSTLYNCALASNSAASSGGAVSCALYNCTLTGNSANDGGGAAGSTLYNCTLTGNSATADQWGRNGYGGGAETCTLYNCTLSGNVALFGGGAVDSMLYNCTVTGNSGGGVISYWYNSYWNTSTLFNSIVYGNSGGNFNEGTTLNYCCTTPMPTNGDGNIDADPRFVNAAAGDVRLRPDSPCIDAGANLPGLLATDITGLPRALDGNGDGVARVDMGAYEFNPYRFEPTLQMTVNGLVFVIRGEPGRSVRIERSRDLVNWEWAATVPIPANGQTLIDPAATTEPRLFYRAMRVP